MKKNFCTDKGINVKVNQDLEIPKTLDNANDYRKFVKSLAGEVVPIPGKSIFSFEALGIKAGPFPQSVIIYNVKTGEELPGVYSVDINLCLDDIATAKVEMHVSKVKMEGVCLEQVRFFEILTGKKYKLVEVSNGRKTRKDISI